MTDFTERRLSGETLFHGKVFSIERDDVLLPNGAKSTREVVRHPGGVAVLAVDEHEGIYLVRQFRYAAGRELLEIPAGRIEPGEDPAVAGRRELAEETGLRCAKFESLGMVLPTPGYDTERIYLYLASGLTQGDCCPDDGEFVRAVYMPLNEAQSLVLSGGIDDAKTMAALYRYALRAARG